MAKNINTKNTIGFKVNSKKGLKTINERPLTKKNHSNINYVIMNQEILNNIMKKCLPKAGGSEFQFHYWALQIKLASSNGRRFTLTYPLAFFNFPQTVTGGSVDFNLPQVDNEAQKVKEPAKKLAKILMSSFPKEFFQENGFTVKFEFGDVGSIHRHPGRFGFSSIDLRYDPMKPGVIYRNKTGHDLWQTDSVLYCGTEAELFTTETRIFNITQIDPNNEDLGSKGVIEETPTVMIMAGGKEDSLTEKSVDFSDFFGIEKEEEVDVDVDFFTKSTMNAQVLPDAVEVALMLADYKPLDFVDENKIEQAVTRYASYGYGFYGNDYGAYGYNHNFGYTKKNKKSKKKDKKNQKELVYQEESYNDIYNGIPENFKLVSDEAEFDLSEIVEGSIEFEIADILKELANLKNIEELNEKMIWDAVSDQDNWNYLIEIVELYGKSNKLILMINSGVLELEVIDNLMPNDNILYVDFYVGGQSVYSEVAYIEKPKKGVK